MIKKIKFRAENINNEIVFGFYYINQYGKHCIITNELVTDDSYFSGYGIKKQIEFEIKPETLCQLVCIKDNIEIYENVGII